MHIWCIGSTKTTLVPEFGIPEYLEKTLEVRDGRRATIVLMHGFVSHSTRLHMLMKVM